MSTYTPIASQTLTASASSVTFSGIPQTYTDLILVIQTKPYTSSEGSIRLTLNGDSGSNYSFNYMAGDGTSPIAGKGANTSFIPLSYGNSLNNPRQPVTIIQILNYTNTATNKTILSRTSSADASGYTDAFVGMWRNTNAVTSLTIGISYIFNIGAGSTFNLYGVANASISNVAKATGGDSVYTDGTYWYHIFRSSGVFTPTANLTADYLVVAGGGGTGATLGGGGGAGGLRSTVTATGGGGSLESAVALTSATAYTITVGAGGSGGTTGVSGSNSSIAGSGLTTITSIGGGAGGKYNGGSGSSGGSGGGGGAEQGITGAGGAGTANQGYAGARGTSNTAQFTGGGGGGAGAVGTSQNGTDNGGTGGAGVATVISGSSTTYAGGGGGGGNASGGNGGAGGGGKAGNNGGYNATAGTANTGGGAGGGGNGGTINGTSGGSGIVIVRYAA